MHWCVLGLFFITLRTQECFEFVPLVCIYSGLSLQRAPLVIDFF